MSDIVNELLSRASDEDGIGWTPTTIIPVPARLLHHAADRIEQLEAALRKYACGCSGRKCDPDTYPCGEDARAALEGRT